MTQDNELEDHNAGSTLITDMHFESRQTGVVLSSTKVFVSMN
jgi:hypothetical protein